MLTKELEFGILIDRIMVEFLFSELKKSNLTQKDLAEALKLNNAQTVTHWKKFLEEPTHEKANAIPHKYWFAICKFFNVELVDIINKAAESDKLTTAEIKLIKEIREKNIFEHIKNIVSMTTKQ